MFGLGAGELLIILVFALVFIGPKKLPELAKSLGKGLREFQRAKDDLMDHINHPNVESNNAPEYAVEDKKSDEIHQDASSDQSEVADKNNQEKNV